MRGPLLLVLLAGCLDSPGHATGLGRQIVFHPPAIEADDLPLAFVRAEDPELAAAASSDGSDIHFVDGSGAVLPHEIERFEPETGGLVAWVRVPQLADGASIELRYAGSAVAEDRAALWQGYAGVWHLAEDPTGLPPQFIDSTENGISGSTIDEPPESFPQGIAGSALLFDRTNTVDLGDPDSLDFGLGSFSVEVWVLVPSSEALSEYDRPWHKGGTSAELAPDVIRDDWVHLVAVVDRAAGELSVFRDGAPAQTIPLGGLTDLSSARRAIIGGPTDTETGFSGVVDEVRVRADALSKEWIAAQHASLRAPDSFFEMGAEQPFAE